MLDITKLQRATKKFFDRHWNEVELGKSSPKWELTSASFTGPVPNHNKGGCYALIQDKELLYIGSALTIFDGRSDGFAISRRLMSHAIKTDPESYYSYVPRKKWDGLTEIATIGFDRNLNYIAAGLEYFLIRELNPPRNKRA